MKLQSKLFILFSLSILISAATAFPVVIRLLKHQDTLLENPVISLSLSRIMKDDVIRESSDRLFEEAVKINREYTKLKILKQDYFFSSVASFLSFLLIQAVLLVILFLFLSRALTSQLRAVTEGLKKIESGSREYRFPSLKGSEFLHLSGELNRLMDSLSEKEKLLQEQAKYIGWQEVASFLSHQLKNPLTAIELSGKNLDLLVTGKEAGENVTIVLEECRRLRTLLKRFAEITSFPELKKETCDISSLLKKLALRFTGNRGEVLLKAPDQCFLSADKAMIEQAFHNLFMNSMEAAEESRLGKVIIETAVDKKEKGICITVRDSMKGLDPSLKDKVMLPKFTTKNYGSGLGLPFVQKVVSLHGGTLSVSMTEAGGLQFSLFFPGYEAD